MYACLSVCMYVLLPNTGEGDTQESNGFCPGKG